MDDVMDCCLYFQKNSGTSIRQKGEHTFWSASSLDGMDAEEIGQRVFRFLQLVSAVLTDWLAKEQTSSPESQSLCASRRGFFSSCSLQA